ncbi:DUF4136 domain-containing protein [Pacificimonas flava]|uniref:DUF4136 domain-containing protein n=1 Tax=Pacificimonas flava TaxID=1234595 RepID=M2SEA4_9SPHN|nr:DUF4136 domain-containing protein [Pacificimonas flava]EMD83690.1 hypothetical protein C725_0662 [Pacificimonas flava]MBB5280628.1 hypothetical protein [Pacificimonas flava]
MNILKGAVLGAALTLTAACTTPFTADVSRFQRLPAPTGETFAIVPADESLNNSLEFQNYARLIAGELVEEGYREVASADGASMVVSMAYGVGNPREKIASRPSGRMGFGYGGWGNPWWGGYGGWYGRGWGYDPFFYGGGFADRDVYSYTVYNSYLDLDIRRPGGEPLFEGRAVAATRDDNLPEIVPDLVTAMFTDFPGMNGRTITVKVPEEDRR